MAWVCVNPRWLGHGTMAILTVHGCGFYALWLWEHNWLRGLIWDRNGTNMLAGGGPSLPVRSTRQHRLSVRWDAPPAVFLELMRCARHQTWQPPSI